MEGVGNVFVFIPSREHFIARGPCALDTVGACSARLVGVGLDGVDRTVTLRRTTRAPRRVPRRVPFAV